MEKEKSILLVLLTLLNSGRISQGRTIFYHNLTAPIQQALVGQTEEYKVMIRDALKLSPFVYYESDVLLSKIENILPVIDLLQEFSENNTIPKLILSLPYTNKTTGMLMSNRLDDIFYNPDFRIGFESRSKIADSVVAIVLDFSRSPPSFGRSLGPYQISFTGYVKKFIKSQFGEGVIQVGLKFDIDSCPEDCYFFSQICKADFVVADIQVNVPEYFPMTFETFADTTTAKVKSFERAILKYSDITNMAKKVHLLPNLKIVETKANNFVMSSYLYGSGMARALSMTTNYTNISEGLAKSTQQTAIGLFRNIALQWSMSNGLPIIISSILRDPTVNLFCDETPAQKSQLQIPFIHAQQPVMNATHLKTNLTIWKSNYHRIVVDELMWTEIRRFHEEQNISENEDNIDMVSLNVSVKFNEGLKEMWSGMDSQMKQLVLDHSMAAGLNVNTVIFSDYDIKGSDQIRDYLKLAKSKGYNTGCSMSFQKFQNIQYQERGSYVSFRNATRMHLCNPLFDSLHTFVWVVPDVQTYHRINVFRHTGLSSGYTH